VRRDPLRGGEASDAERIRYERAAMLLDDLPLTDRIRFQFYKAPTARRVRERDERLRGSPQTPLALHADGERLERPEQRYIAGRAASHHTKGTTGRTTGQSFG
jgi:hypothetical protein